MWIGVPWWATRCCRRCAFGDAGRPFPVMGRAEGFEEGISYGDVDYLRTQSFTQSARTREIVFEGMVGYIGGCNIKDCETRRVEFRGRSIPQGCGIHRKLS